MATHTDSMRALMIISVIFETVALFICTFRLWIRIRLHRVGWDDAWVAGALICGTANVVSDWIHIAFSGVDTPTMIFMWIDMYARIYIVWSVRISVIFSIIRILSPEEKLHKSGLIIVVFYALNCGSFIAQRAVRCTKEFHAFDPSPSTPYFSCVLPEAVVISELALDCLADVISVIFPLYVLRRAKLPSKQYRLLRLLFATSFVISVVSCVRTVSQTVPRLSPWLSVIVNFQVAICLIVGNLLVVVTYLYRVFGCKCDSDESTSKPITEGPGGLPAEHNDATPSCMTRRMSLTTIELVFSTRTGVSRSMAADVVSRTAC